MKKALTLSIVIPVYNEENYIGACLAAIKNQSEAPDEVIVVDNGSTDKTAEIIRGFSFVRVIDEKKQSVLYARNTGFNSVKSDLIGRIDADTLLSPDWVKRAKDLFDNPAVHAVTGPSGIYDMPFPRFTRWMHDGLLRIAVFGGFHFLTGSNMVMRKSAWSSVKKQLCQDLTYYEDIDLATHLERSAMTALYSSVLWNSVSARRFNNKLSDFVRYIRRYSHTLKHHKARTIGSYYAEFAYLITYFTSKPLFWFFNPLTRRFSFKYLFATKQRRIDPMDGRSQPSD